MLIARYVIANGRTAPRLVRTSAHYFVFLLTISQQSFHANMNFSHFFWSLLYFTKQSWRLQACFWHRLTQISGLPLAPSPGEELVP